MVDIDARGVVDYRPLEKRLQDTTEKTLVSLMHANNEIGTMLDIERVGGLSGHMAFFIQIPFDGG